jgi:hypothetical protein
MTKKTTNTKTAKQLEAEINKIKLDISNDNEKKRKARTRRLIRKGALLEKIFGLEDFTVEETEVFLTDIYNKLK